MQDDPTEEMQNKQVQQNNNERKRAMAKERSRRFREKNRLNVLKSVHHVVHSFHFCRVVLSTHSFSFVYVCAQGNCGDSVQNTADDSHGGRQHCTWGLRNGATFQNAHVKFQCFVNVIFSERLECPCFNNMS